MFEPPERTHQGPKTSKNVILTGLTLSQHAARGTRSAQNNAA